MCNNKKNSGIFWQSVKWSERFRNYTIERLLFVKEKEGKTTTQNVSGIMDKGVAGVDEFQSNHNSHLEVF